MNTNPNQFGFKRKHGTTDQCIYVCHGVCNKLHKCGCSSFDVETINNEFRI